MLKKFFLNALSSFVGAWIALVLFGICAVLIAVGLVSQVKGSSESVSIKKHSVLVLDLNGSIIVAETANSPDYIALMQGNVEKPQTLNVIVKALSEAANNKSIDALYIKGGVLSAAPATVNAIRDAVKEFKKVGKKIFAYSDNYTLGSYYIASVADSVLVNPYGGVRIDGLNGQSIFMKGLFDKLGVEFQVVKVGTFKSAVEPYISREMSAPARAQLDTLYGAMWDYMRKGICENRKKLTLPKIDSLVNNGLTFATADKLVRAGFVDKAVYERTVDDRIAALVGVKKEKLNYVSTSLVAGEVPWNSAYASKNQIAVLYATGEIVDGANGGIDYMKLVPLITKLADDDNIKGMVLRVNSPGGSAFGSDQIGEALDYFMSKDKPLAVSMGDYAASGGYWISCGADRIFADPLTITGSIGIFGLIPNVKGLADKLGINVETVGTNVDANFPTLYAPLNERQLSIMQEYVNDGYDRFINRVSKGRKMPEAKVRTIAEGRVWNAMKAKEIGLVDALGSLNDAIEWTAGKAGIRNKYDAAAYPLFEPSFWDLIAAGEFGTQVLSELSGDKWTAIGTYMLKDLMNKSRIQARMPAYDFRIN